MATIVRALLASACVLTATACSTVFTVDEIVTESASMVDDRFIGEWAEIGGDDRASVVRGSGRDYAVTYLDGFDTSMFRVRIGRLGPSVVLDVFPDSVQWKETKQAGFPMHMAFAVIFDGDSMGVSGLTGDSVKKQLTSGRLRIPYTLVNGGDVLLHGDASVVRSTLASLFQQRAVVDEVAWFRRDRARTDSALAARNAERNAIIGFLRNMLVAQEVFFTDSSRYASKVSSLAVLRIPPTMTVRTLNGGGGFWNAIVTSLRLPGVECAIAVASANPLNPAAAEGEPFCR